MLILYEIALEAQLSHGQQCGDWPITQRRIHPSLCL